MQAPVRPVGIALAAFEQYCASGMNLLNPRKLQTKFLLGLAVIMAVMGVFFITLLQMHLRQNLEQEVRGKALLILSNVDTLQHSVQTGPSPAMSGGQPQVACELEAMSSSSISRAVMDSVGKDLKQFRFRRVAESARNPDFEADPLERRLLARFREDPSLASAEYFHKGEGGETFILAQPVVLKASCLRCHGDPAVAPREILEKYGPERGFRRKEGELVGAHVVSLPVEGGLSRIRGATLAFVSMFSVGALLLFGAINIYFNRLVVHNLSRTLSVMRRHFPDQAPGGASSSTGTTGDEDEIEQVLASVRISPPACVRPGASWKAMPPTWRPWWPGARRNCPRRPRPAGPTSPCSWACSTA